MFDNNIDNVQIRPFLFEDISKKIEWINNPDNNKYLHYELPLEYDKTVEWYNKNKDNDNRFDGIILYENVPVGLIGLLSIDKINRKAEYYVCLGYNQYKGKGIAKKASLLLIDFAFKELGLNKIYLYTEEENISAQKLFEKIGFEKEGLLKQDLIYQGRIVNRCVYGYFRTK